MMPKLTSHSGVPMPAILYGTAWKEEKTADYVAQAIGCGFRGIDTACQPKHYHEPGVGEGMKRGFTEKLTRDDLYIQTKFTPIQGQDPHRIPYDPNTSVTEQVQQSVVRSQSQLGIKTLDSLVLHGPLPEWQDTVEAWKALEQAQKSGQARQIGLSNCYEVELFNEILALAEIKPAILQNRFYQDTGYDRELRQLCDEHSIVYQCFWTLTANPHILENPIVVDIASNHNKTQVQIFFRFIHQLGIQILTGTTSEQHMREDLEIFSFELTKQDIASIKALGPF